MLFSNAKKLYLHSLQQKGRSKGTIKGYKIDLNEVEKFLVLKLGYVPDVEDIKIDDIKEYILMMAMKKGYQPSTCNRCLNTLKSFYKFACSENIASSNIVQPLQSIKVPKKEPTFLTNNEFQDLIQAIDHDLIRLVIKTLFYTGIRISECLSLRLEHIDFKNDKIYIFHGKGNKNRTIPLNQSLRKYLQEYIEQWRPIVSSNRLFVTARTGSLSDIYVNRILRKSTQKLKWDKRVTCHTLRHTFASTLVDKNVNLVVIKELLGHESLKTTSIYSHTVNQRLEEAIALLL